MPVRTWSGLSFADNLRTVEAKGITMRNSVRGTLAAVAALGALLVPATAEATPGSGVTGVILSKTTLGKTDYILREITIQPGGGTGWHFHDGTLYAFVKAGTLTHNDADC